MALKQTINLFDLQGKVVIITGGAGMLGVKHAEAISLVGGIPVLWDINKEALMTTSFFGVETNITDPKSIKSSLEKVLKKYGRIDALINNAANNPKVEAKDSKTWSRLENFPLDIWNKDIDVGLTGAFLCSQIVGAHLAKQKKGVIINIASDLGLIAPDQRIYRQQGVPDDKQPVKPVTYSVVKHALIGLSKYLATYWADKGVRVNTVCFGGVFNNQSDDFVQKLTKLIPMGRMARKDEYGAAIVFLLCDASSYMTGSVLVIDGGRTCW